MSNAGKDGDVPSWNGDPDTFERLATECKWCQHSLKASEKQLAAPRVWHRLVGFAKSVVRNLDPTAYSTQNGLDKLLEVLRMSPLQRLPVPDTFQRLERWSGLHRRQGESIPQFLVREEELFVELQQSLIRARSVKGKDQKVIIAEHPPDEVEEEEAAETEEKDDDKDGAASPKGAKAASEPSPTSTRTRTTKMTATSGPSLGFFEG